MHGATLTHAQWVKGKGATCYLARLDIHMAFSTCMHAHPSCVYPWQGAYICMCACMTLPGHMDAFMIHPQRTRHKRQLWSLWRCRATASMITTCLRHTHPLSPAGLSPSCCHTCYTRWSRAGWTCPASPTPARWPAPPCSRRTSASCKSR